jgi:hypothetical protein
LTVSFRTDQSGRLVFLPFGSKGKAYFVDSKSDEGKIRSFLKMYRSASTLFSPLGFLSVFVPVWTRIISAGASPLGDKFPTLVGNFAALLLILGVSAWMLWVAYKETVPEPDRLAERGLTNQALRFRPGTQEF